MLTAILAHQGQPPAAAELWTRWHFDPLLLLGLVLAAALYARGRAARRRGWSDDRRAVSFALGLLALALALVSPLHALAGVLASAHMVQHVLLLVVAAPLLALGGPWRTVFKGMPLVVRRRAGKAFARLGLMGTAVDPSVQAIVVSLLHVAAIWFWHSSSPYGLALENDSVHIAQHLSLLVAAMLFWGVIVRSGPRALSYGCRILLVFGMAMQGVFLAVLMTFAPTPWYEGYTRTTSRWGVDALADQQLAGAIMWVPGGLVYLAAALLLTLAWIGKGEVVAERHALDDRQVVHRAS